MPPFFSGQRHLGLILSTMGWLILSFITIILPRQVNLYESPGLINLFAFHFAVVIIFFFFGIPYGLKFFSCNNSRLVLFRGALAVLSFFGFIYAKEWSPNVDHSLLYSIDPLWVILLLLIANYKIAKLSWIGIVLSLIGVVTVYYFNATGWRDLQGFIFGISSGAGLAVIILITYSLIKTDHTCRIGFYHGVIGCIFSLTLLTYFYLTNNVIVPPLREIIISLFFGGAFAYSLFCFIQSTLYVEAYAIGATGYSLIFFTEIFNWILTRELLPLSSIIGVSLIVFGGIKVVLGTYITEEKKRFSM